VEEDVLTRGAVGFAGDIPAKESDGCGVGEGDRAAGATTTTPAGKVSTSVWRVLRALCACSSKFWVSCASWADTRRWCPRRIARTLMRSKPIGSSDADNSDRLFRSAAIAARPRVRTAVTLAPRAGRRYAAIKTDTVKRPDINRSCGKRN
jgi:hypothetical protein